MNLKRKAFLFGPPCSILYGLFLLFNTGIVELIPLKIDGAKTVGTVTRVADDYHITYEYEISVNGKRYTSGGLGRSCNIQKGDKLSVFYSQSNPSLMYNGNVDEKLSGDLTCIALVMLIFPIITVLIIDKKFPDKPRRKTQEHQKG